jgi:hypothetical protein
MRVSASHRTVRGQRKGTNVGGDQVDEVGPVDYAVVELPPGHRSFTAEMARELVALSEAGTIRILDLLVVERGEDGAIEAFEIDDRDVVEELVPLEAEISEILAAKDVAHLAECMEDGTTAGVVVWENRWAVSFAAAASRGGAKLIASGRIPAQAIAASFESEPEDR